MGHVKSSNSLYCVLIIAAHLSCPLTREIHRLDLFMRRLYQWYRGIFFNLDPYDAVVGTLTLGLYLSLSLSRESQSASSLDQQ